MYLQFFYLVQENWKANSNQKENDREIFQVTIIKLL